MAFTFPVRMTNGQTYELPANGTLDRLVAVIDSTAQGKHELRLDTAAGQLVTSISADTPVGTTYVPVELGGLSFQKGQKLFCSGDSVLLIFR